jgi:hypothetical protein
VLKSRKPKSTGSARNLPYPHAWRYRDYVIDAFNKDKPYDQFVREHAGDCSITSMDPSLAWAILGGRGTTLPGPLSPGFTMTGMAEEYLTSRGGDAILKEIPLGRVNSAEEVASAIFYLAIHAPPAMTGAVLDINGASYVR